MSEDKAQMLIEIGATDITVAELEAFGKALPFIRECLNFDQKELAGLFGVSRVTISYIENGKTRLTKGTFYGFGHLLNLYINEYFSDEREALGVKAAINNRFARMLDPSFKHCRTAFQKLIQDRKERY